MGIRVLTVPQWSFGRDRVLLASFSDLLAESNCKTHYCASNVDHNRTVTAFSGEFDEVVSIIEKMAEICLPSIDLNRHTGSHPRIGALDVCPFVPLDFESTIESELQLRNYVHQIEKKIAAKFGIPVYLYEKSEENSQESELPSLRNGGFGGLIGRRLCPDFGPQVAHPQWGVATVGVRDFLLSGAVNLRNDDGAQARRIARLIRYARMEGDERFMGVRVMALAMPTLEQMQIKFDLTMPNQTQVDQVIDLILREATCNGATLGGTELFGAIRPQDVPYASRVKIDENQIVEGAA
jgi:glutamate formiminotransferase